MMCIVKNCKKFDEGIISLKEKEYSILIRDDIKAFLKQNSGGDPIKGIISIHGDNYELRNFLSVNKEDEYFGIEKPMNYFLTNTKGKIVPIGLDSGDNYYCVNNETGKVYYWSAEENQYYCLTDSLEEFVKLFHE